MLKRIGVALAAVAAMGLVASQASAQNNKDQQKCQQTVAKSSSKQVATQVKCVDKCMVAKRKLTPGPLQYAECLPPYVAATETLDCIDTAEDKAEVGIGKKCDPDQTGKTSCPACGNYANPGQCDDGQPQVGTNRTLTNAQAGSVYCLEAALNPLGGTPSAEGAKCESKNGQRLAKWVASINKCYDKCTKNKQAGKVQPGSSPEAGQPYNCTPALGDTGPLDATTAACLTKARDKTGDQIAKDCGVASRTALLTPVVSCYGSSPLIPDTAAGWVALVEGLVSGQTGGITCLSSPSGAFLN